MKPPPEPPREEGKEADRSDYDPDYRPEAPVICDICDTPMHYTASCRITCPNCGYTRDCSDP